MNSPQAGIYADSAFSDTDIGAVMRDGHPDIIAGDQHILAVIRSLREKLGRPLRILDVGAGSAHLSFLLAQEFQEGEIIANEIADAPIGQARAKLAPFPHTRVFDRSFDEWNETVDVIVSWGTHHHLSHDYLTHVCKLLTPDGLLIIGDEMCPEYLTASDQQRLLATQTIEIVDGYIFDCPTDIDSYHQTGVVPEWSLRLELARRKALWKWYKFVGDYAVAQDCWTVLIAELQIARDDIITGFAEEHKTSPFLLARELELNGMKILERKAIGDRPPTLQSFIIYTCRPTAVGLTQ